MFLWLLNTICILHHIILIHANIKPFYCRKMLLQHKMLQLFEIRTNMRSDSRRGDSNMKKSHYSSNKMKREETQTHDLSMHV